MIKVTDIAQHTDEWIQLRVGIPTASNFDMIVDTKGNESKQRKKYLYQLAGERIIGGKEEGYYNAAMLRGIAMEKVAKMFYEMTFDVEIEEVSFCYIDEDKKIGCSPDGLIGEDGGIEIKCPILSTHVKYLLEDRLPPEYFQQVQGCMYVTGRKWWHFVSYYPGLKPLIIKVHRDETFITKLDDNLKRFCLELDEVEQKIW